MDKHNNHRVLVTGGGSGIGLAITRSLASSGAEVVIVGRRAAVLNKAVSDIGPNVRALAADLLDGGYEEIVARASELAGGPISCLINNAGIHRKAPFSDLSRADYQAVMATHLGAAWGLTQAVIPEMRKVGHGHVCFIASMVNYFGIPQVAAYSAAKGALEGLLRALTVELGPQNIRVNAIAPGWIDTDMSRGAFAGDPDRLERVLTRTPLGRLGSPEDIAATAEWLCSPQARFITGAMIPVDGGARLGF